jgi:hypothetical protein
MASEMSEYDIMCGFWNCLADGLSLGEFMSAYPVGINKSGSFTQHLLFLFSVIVFLLPIMITKLVSLIC